VFSGQCWPTYTEQDIKCWRWQINHEHPPKANENKVTNHPRHKNSWIKKNGDDTDTLEVHQLRTKRGPPNTSDFGISTHTWPTQQKKISEDSIRWGDHIFMGGGANKRVPRRRIQLGRWIMAQKKKTVNVPTQKNELIRTVQLKRTVHWDTRISRGPIP